MWSPSFLHSFLSLSPSSAPFSHHWMLWGSEPGQSVQEKVFPWEASAQIKCVERALAEMSFRLDELAESFPGLSDHVPLVWILLFYFCASTQTQLPARKENTAPISPAQRAYLYISKCSPSPTSAPYFLFLKGMPVLQSHIYLLLCYTNQDLFTLHVDFFFLLFESTFAIYISFILTAILQHKDRWHFQMVGGWRRNLHQSLKSYLWLSCSHSICYMPNLYLICSWKQPW